MNEKESIQTDMNVYKALYTQLYDDEDYIMYKLFSKMKEKHDVKFIQFMEEKKGFRKPN